MVVSARTDDPGARWARYEFRSREEAAAVAQHVASLLPEAIRVEFVLVELMVNAVEHGNLEIKAAKPELVRRGELEQEVARRRADPRYCDRVAWLEVTREDAEVTFVIGDQGPGFAWQAQTSLPVNDQPSGRGLVLARLMSSSGLAFNPEGNIVTVSVRW
ncbi:MAG TPA: ATP-binding protein [Kofleriaceae bacterium]